MGRSIAWKNGALPAQASAGPARAPAVRPPSAVSTPRRDNRLGWRCETSRRSESDMAGVVSLGGCMVEGSLAGSGRAVIGFAGDAFNTAVYLSRLGVPAAFATALGDGDPFSAGI